MIDTLPASSWTHIVKTLDDGSISLTLIGDGAVIRVDFTEDQAKKLAVRLLRGC